MLKLDQVPAHSPKHKLLAGTFAKTGEDLNNTILSAPLPSVSESENCCSDSSLDHK